MAIMRANLSTFFIYFGLPRKLPVNNYVVLIVVICKKRQFIFLLGEFSDNLNSIYWASGHYKRIFLGLGHF